MTDAELKIAITSLEEVNAIAEKLQSAPPPESLPQARLRRASEVEERVRQAAVDAVTRRSTLDFLKKRTKEREEMLRVRGEEKQRGRKRERDVLRGLGIMGLRIEE